MRTILAFLVLSIATAPAHAAPATLSETGGHYRMENAAIAAHWTVAAGKLSALTVTDRIHTTELPVAMPFAILMKDGALWNAATLAVSGEPSRHELTPNPHASRLAGRMHGQQFDLPLESADHAVRAVWSVILLDDAQYLRQRLTITAQGHDAAITRIELIDLPLPGAQVVGSVKGSPIVSGNLYLGFEDPLSLSRVTAGRATAWVERDLPLKAGQSITYSSVFGVAHSGQMRRDFLAYVERERAHPYRTFLHYNSWYDLGYFTPYDQAGVLDRIHTFGRELTEKRGVKLDSFLFDDGWDKHNSLWKFNDGFPNGFTPVKDAAAKYDAAPGIWMSPWGGYSKPKQERIAFGKEAGYEIVRNGYALSGPRYYAAFRDVALDMVKTYGVNQFKFDGTGNVDSVFPGSAFDSDFAAAIHLIAELREAKPDLYVNLTTGTWPSPFWLEHADSIWRGGEDDGVTGVGTYRERWITYRDAITYENIVQAGPLFPLNSLMLHGMIYAKFRKLLDVDPGNDLRNEIHSYFGTGTQLQEMYMTPSLLTEANWDDLAEAAKWSRANADVLQDTHWVGSNPAWLEVYGWASWSPRKGILVLRNPSDKPQTISLKLADTLELPPGAAQSYRGRSPWKSDADRKPLLLQASQAHAFTLAPFEVMTLDLTPR
ncbi:hypothetical protein SAMN05421771_0909 [Granulicella pectinivorans]|uniref:Melibiase n=1 Tax=Granulicella pectinivorans TaxID=474950 RepID=A0A1I6LMB7_9BACT|nr:enterotoxin [Granulicella pectinivorans]SFS04382.1 hypothetical protein SAMN05421771_0909 [Granulicella pectinivorans]